MNSRIEAQHELLTSLGMLLAPLRRLIFEESNPVSEIPYVRSQFLNDLRPFQNEVTKYCRTEEHQFDTELNAILRDMNGFASYFNGMQYPELVEETRRSFDRQLKKVQAAIRSVPCDDLGIILPSSSPYSTFLYLRAIFQTATTRLQLFDPYLRSESFHRYLSQVNAGIQLTILTSSEIMDLSSNASVISSKVLRRNQIVALSELLAKEFPHHYQFRVSTEQHDRHIRVDDMIFHLGGSVDRASAVDYYTISTLDPTQSNHAFLDGIINRATEWYGPNVPQHRQQ